MKTPAEIFETLVARVLDGPGETTPAARKAAAGTGADGLPAPFLAILDRIRTSAYKITDHDLVDLTKAGMSDDEVFELTIAASVGVAKRRRDAALTAIAAASGGK